MPDLQVINITPHTLMTTHEIVRDLANFKMYKKECTPHAPLRSTSTCSDPYTQEVVMTGLRRVDSLAARCLMSRGRNKRAMVSRQKQEYQRQSRDVNNTRQGSRSQAQVQSSKVGQSRVKHRDSRMNRRTLRNVTRGKQDFALGECLCAAFM